MILQLEQERCRIKNQEGSNIIRYDCRKVSDSLEYKMNRKEMIIIEDSDEKKYLSSKMEKR